MSTHKQTSRHIPEFPPSADSFQQNWDGVTPYAVATIVRTSGPTAVKAGGRAVVTSEGTLIGFTGGGCMRRAIIDAGLTTIAEHEPRLIRTRPKDLVKADAGDDSITTYATSCPSRGEAEIFLEPVLPLPPLVVFGETEIASHVKAFGAAIGLRVLGCAAEASEQEDIFPIDKLPALTLIDQGYIVIATQGVGDKVALMAALSSPCPHVLFVASRRKAAHWRETLAGQGIAAERLEELIAPAGIDIGAKGPSEIAVSIIAQIVELRRRAEAVAEPAHGKAS